MGLKEKFFEKARHTCKKIVLPEGTDERIQKAAEVLKKECIADPVLVGDKDEITSLASQRGIDCSNLEIVDPLVYSELPELVNLYSESRKVKKGVAERLLKKELVFGGMLLAAGKVDGMVAGAASTTASVIQASALTVGYASGISTPSSFFIMELPDGRVLFYADCAVNIDPSAQQLAEISISTSSSFQKIMGQQPKTALLSFSTKGSASHPFVDKVQQAVSLAKEIVGDSLCIDGEFQADTALVEAVASKKIKEPSPVAGQANVLIFPDLDAGNIAYKLTQYLAGASAFGPILQGFAKPVSDLSRGAKVEDIVVITAIVCCLV
ncbi:MAG: phosphate acetyltransferase [Candidatus Omnitrophica bacterium]|nr:phosphate acetyltransferase [Candidatus Omnitrophota bacterium]